MTHAPDDAPAAPPPPDPHADPQTEPHTENLWARASGCFQAFEKLFGEARALMDGHVMRLTEARPARAFLRGLEALVRRLLLVRALDLLPHLSPNTTTRRANIIRRKTDWWDLPEDPAHWPAPFAYRLSRLLAAPESSGAPPAPPAPPAPRAQPCHIGCALKEALGRRAPCAPKCPKLKIPLDAARAFTTARPTALRLEVLRRIIDNPEPFALRLARLYRAHANPAHPATGPAHSRESGTLPRPGLILAPPPRLAAAHTPFLMVALASAGRLAQYALEPPLPPDTS